MDVYLDTDGRPFVTSKPLDESPIFNKTGPASQAPQPFYKVHVKIFDLSDATQLEEYKEIFEMVGIGIARVSSEERQWVPGKENWKVFLRWCIPSSMSPSELRFHRKDAATKAFSDTVVKETKL